MKKLVLCFMAIFIAAFMAACGCGGDNNNGGTGNNGNTNNGNGMVNEVTDGNNMGGNGNNNTKNYKDGTYTGSAPAWEYGSETAEVTIKNGKITSVILKRLDTSGKEVDYEQWTGKEINGTTYPNLKQYREDIARAIIDKQGTQGVDTISGANVTTQNWLTAVEMALQKARQ